MTKLYKVAMFLQQVSRAKDSTVSRRHVSFVVQCPHWTSNSLWPKRVFVRARFKDGGLKVFRLLWVTDPGILWASLWPKTFPQFLHEQKVEQACPFSLIVTTFCSSLTIHICASVRGEFADIRNHKKPTVSS